MMNNSKIISLIFATLLITSCSLHSKSSIEKSPAEILGNPDYLAFSYGGYRQKTRDIVPTVEELKDDMRILAAMGVKIIRTYNTRQFAQAANLLQAIRQLKDENPSFEMYVMLGAWIDCKDAWTDSPNHKAESIENNTIEIQAAVDMANTYPDIVKVIAVGNESMVQWAANYFVYPDVILKWVNYLQELKKSGKLSINTWITSSDNYESWGGGAKSYQTDDLAALVEAVDYVSMHTYPFHESHYVPEFWGVPEDEESLSDVEKINAAMQRAKKVAISQYQNVRDYIESLGIEKPIHIGETGWASMDDSFYGADGSKAADEYKEKLYYEHMREWTNESGMACFFFEAFDEQWKDENSPAGSENHFGLINLKGQAKYALWDMVDDGVFDGLTRNGFSISKTYGGDEAKLLADIQTPPLKKEMGILEINTVNEKREPGQAVEEETYIVLNESLIPSQTNKLTYPSATLKLNPWEGTCSIEMSADGFIEVVTGTAGWWGCALEMQADGKGENLSNFKGGYLNFDIKGNTTSTFTLGFQTGIFSQGNQTNNFVEFGPAKSYSLKEEWETYSIAISELNKGANLSDVTGLLYFRGDLNFDGKQIQIRNIYYSK
ncbi:glycosyl hydrolase family 17 protein [Bacteroidota bacterium]